MARVLAFALALGFLAPAAVAGPVATCDLQAPCLSLDVTLDGSPGCGYDYDCTYTACMTLDTNNIDCDKDGATLSHTCDQSGSDECPYDPAMWDVDEATEVTVNEQCQTGGPGQELKFLYKDGQTCSASGTSPMGYTLQNGATAECRASTTEDRINPNSQVSRTVQFVLVRLYVLLARLGCVRASRTSTWYIRLVVPQRDASENLR